MAINVLLEYPKIGPEDKPPGAHNIWNIKYTKQRKNIKNYKGKEQITYKGRSIRITCDFSKETLKARRAWMVVL